MVKWFIWYSITNKIKVSLFPYVNFVFYSHSARALCLYYYLGKILLIDDYIYIDIIYLSMDDYYFSLFLFQYSSSTFYTTAGFWIQGIFPRMIRHLTLIVGVRCTFHSVQYFASDIETMNFPSMMFNTHVKKGLKSNMSFLFHSSRCYGGFRKCMGIFPQMTLNNFILHKSVHNNCILI